MADTRRYELLVSGVPDLDHPFDSMQAGRVRNSANES
jgi:hypothetical protein